MAGDLYHSFIIVDPKIAAEIGTISVSDHWCLSTHDDPTRRHWASVAGICAFRHHTFLPEGSAFIEGNSLCSEVTIRATDDDTAKNVQSLIYGGITLASLDLPSFRTPPTPIPVRTLETAELMEEPYCSYFAHRDHALSGCLMASKAWTNRCFIYAIEKLKLSLSLDWFTPRSAAPRHGQIFANEHPEYSYHVNAAYAIISAFAAIEELGLEVRSSSQKPRFVGDSKDTWNPDVKKNLIDRLKSAGIDHNESVLWLCRGDPTAVEGETKPKLGTVAPYADEKVVRDRELQLIDAIHYASWLRNCVAAHKFGELTESLSPYDVHNVQLLARRLILSQMGLWKNWPSAKPENGS